MSTYFDSALWWLNSSRLFLSILAALLGLCVGSFLNVVIGRLPLMLFAEAQGKMAGIGLCYPPSHCPSCHHRVLWRDNIPLLSYLCLKGQCRHCGITIRPRYLIIEVAVGLLFAVLALSIGWGYTLLGCCVFSTLLIALVAIDLEHLLLPDCLTLLLLWLGLLYNLRPNAGFVSLPLAVLGAATAYIFFWAVVRIGSFLLKRDGMGLGDAKLLAALGAWFGPKPLIMIILLAALFTIVAIIVRRAFSAVSMQEPMPFGPGLAAAGFVVGVYPYIMHGFSIARP